METLKQSTKALNKAISVLKNGGVVICPTDTVYGFLADATNKKAVEKIYKIKKRPKSKPLPVFVKDFTMASTIAEINEKQVKILKKFWPGKYTFILKRKSLSDVGRRMAGRLYRVDKETIALRVPKYPFLNQLLKKINKPLVQTSVNISGEPPVDTIKDMIEKFGNDKNILIINGGNLKKSPPASATPKALQAGKPSKIIDLTSKTLTVLR